MDREQLINRLEWALKEPRIEEMKSYVSPILANDKLKTSGLDHMQYIDWQFEIGASEPLRKLYVNIVGAIFVGKYQDVDLGWQAYQEFGGPAGRLYDDPGVTYYWSSIIDLPNGNANKLLELHSGLFSKNYPLQTILNHLKEDRLSELS